MKRPINPLIAGWIIFSLLMLATAFLSLAYLGDINRYLSNTTSDSSTRKDIVYQTGDVRVYRFEENNSYCYLTQSYTNSTLYCMEKR